jgi:RHS repeat-associated protein
MTSVFQVQPQENKIAVLSYYDDSRLKSIDRFDGTNGVNLVAKTDYTYDGMGRLQTLTHTGNTAAQAIESHSYSYDSTSRITRIDSTRGSAAYSTTYGYDNHGQLLDAVYSNSAHPLFGQDESFAFDELGNRQTLTESYGRNSMLTENATSRFTYDAEGNLVTQADKATGHVTQYTWDHRNRLTRVQTWDKTTLLRQIDYRYDVLDRRIEKSVNSDGQGGPEVVERFVYNGDHIALAFNGNNQLTNRYLHGPGIDMILADEAFSPTTGNFIDTYWSLADHQGSVTSLVTHNAGTTSVAQRLAYTSFGSIGSIKDGQGNNVTAGPISRFAYTGREFDPETGDYYYRARYFDPQTGRFLSQDPIGFAAGDMNLYRYVSNSTPNFTDPTGLYASYTIDPGPTNLGPQPPMARTEGAGPQGTISDYPPSDPFGHGNVPTMATEAIGDPLSPDSVSQGIWAKIRKGLYDEALDLIECTIDQGGNLPNLRLAMKDIKKLDKWRKQVSQWSLRDLKDTYKNHSKTLREHLEKRNGCDTPETMRIRYQIDFLNERLKERNKGGWWFNGE